MLNEWLEKGKESSDKDATIQELKSQLEKVSEDKNVEIVQIQLDNKWQID